MYVKADLTVVAEAENVIAQAEKTFGRIDGLVNCAAVATRGEWGEVTEAHIDRHAHPWPAPKLRSANASNVQFGTDGVSLRLVQTVSPQLPCAFHADAGVPCPFLSTRFAPRWFARGLQTHRTGAHAAQAAFTREYP